MASKHPSGHLDDPPSAYLSPEHEKEEEEKEMEVREESQPEKSEVEGFETKSSPHSIPQITKLSPTSKDQSLDASSEDEEEVSETDEVTSKNTPQITKLSQTSKNQSFDGSSEEEEGSESDADTTKNSPTASSFVVKPVVNKTNQSIDPKKTILKRALIDAEREKVLPKKTKVEKDHSEDDREGTTKRAGRVWSETDAISILAGMIDYKKEKCTEPHTDMGAFLEYVKGMFGFEVTKTQLYEKVRRLKGKFFANLDKGEKFFLTKPHELECFKLSKKIWGDNNVAGSVDDVNKMMIAGDGVDHIEKKKGIGKNNKNKMKIDVVPKTMEEPAEAEDVSNDKEYVVNNDENDVEDNGQNIASKYPNLVASFSMYTESQRKLIMNGICLVDSKKARELENCWKQLCLKETEFHYKRMELLAKQSRLVVDEWKKKW